MLSRPDQPAEQAQFAPQRVPQGIIGGATDDLPNLIASLPPSATELPCPALPIHMTASTYLTVLQLFIH